MNNHIHLLVLCFILAIVVNYISHKKKDIKRDKYAVLAVGCISGFASFIISLILLSIYSAHWLLIGVLVSTVYAYIMADAKAYKFTK